MTIHLDRTIVPSFDSMDTVEDTQFGGRGIYGNQPDGRHWEMLALGYARPARTASP